MAAKRAAAEKRVYIVQVVNDLGKRETKEIEADGFCTLDTTDGALVLFLKRNKQVFAIPFLSFVSSSLKPADKPAKISAIK